MTIKNMIIKTTIAPILAYVDCKFSLCASFLYLSDNERKLCALSSNAINKNCYLNKKKFKQKNYKKLTC